jgi:hypothetical protein
MTNIHKLDSAVLSDIPGVLRSIANEMEKGNYGKVMAGVVVLECDTNVLEIFGMGAAEKHRAIALMAGGQQILIQRQFGISTDTY